MFLLYERCSLGDLDYESLLFGAIVPVAIRGHFKGIGSCIVDSEFLVCFPPSIYFFFQFFDRLVNCFTCDHEIFWASRIGLTCDEDSAEYDLHVMKN